MDVVHLLQVNCWINLFGVGTLICLYYSHLNNITRTGDWDNAGEYHLVGKGIEKIIRFFFF